MLQSEQCLSLVKCMMGLIYLIHTFLPSFLSSPVTNLVLHLTVAWILAAWVLTIFFKMKNLLLWKLYNYIPKEVSHHQRVPGAKLSTLWQVVNFAYGASREKMGQQQMSGPHGFQLDCSQCDICMIHCVLCSKIFLREKKCYMFLLWQVMNNQGGNWGGKSVLDLSVVR